MQRKEEFINHQAHFFCLIVFPSINLSSLTFYYKQQKQSGWHFHNQNSPQLYKFSTCKFCFHVTTGDHFTKLFCHCITRTSLHPVSKDIFLPSFELSPAVSSQLVVFLLTVVQGNFGFLYHASQNYFSLHLLPDSKTAFTCLGI